jgi:hypothetical protein
LGRGVAFAGALGAGVGLNTTRAAAEQLAEAPWSLTPGDPVPAYQTPSKFAKNAARTLANPNFEPRTSQSRAPLQLLDAQLRRMGYFSRTSMTAFRTSIRVLISFSFMGWSNGL